MKKIIMLALCLSFMAIMFTACSGDESDAKTGNAVIDSMMDARAEKIRAAEEKKTLASMTGPEAMKKYNEGDTSSLTVRIANLYCCNVLDGSLGKYSFRRVDSAIRFLEKSIGADGTAKKILYLTEIETDTIEHDEVVSGDNAKNRYLLYFIAHSDFAQRWKEYPTFERIRQITLFTPWLYFFSGSEIGKDYFLHGDNELGKKDYRYVATDVWLDCNIRDHHQALVDLLIPDTVAISNAMEMKDVKISPIDDKFLKVLADFSHDTVLGKLPALAHYTSKNKIIAALNTLPQKQVVGFVAKANYPGLTMYDWKPKKG